METAEPATISCHRCDDSVFVEDAVAGGEWIPCYFDENTNMEVGPICPTCAAALGVLFDSKTHDWYLPRRKNA